MVETLAYEVPGPFLVFKLGTALFILYVIIFENLDAATAFFKGIHPPFLQVSLPHFPFAEVLMTVYTLLFFKVPSFLCEVPTPEYT